MVEISSVESIEHNSIDTSNLNSQQFRLNKISEIEDYFNTEIRERELVSKKLGKYISFFDYFDKSLIVLSAASGSISIASFTTVIGTPIGIASASLSLAFSLCTGLVKQLLSEALINNQINHEDFMTIINEERNYRELKESIKVMKGQEEKKIDID